MNAVAECAATNDIAPRKAPMGEPKGRASVLQFFARHGTTRHDTAKVYRGYNTSWPCVRRALRRAQRYLPQEKGFPCQTDGRWFLQ